MTKVGLFRILVILACFTHESELLDNGLARTPPMGWISWGYYGCAYACDKKDFCLNEALIMDVADKLHSEGYQQAGFEYIVIDDCWSERQRDIYGNLVPSFERFPRGMKFLADYIHSKGLKFGLYANTATVTCETFPGSRNQFKRDAKQFAAWEIDYLKVDGCFVENEYLDKAFIDFGTALNKTGRPIVYSCSWPYYKRYIHKDKPKYELSSKYCNLWRNTHDIKPNWANLLYTMKDYQENSQYYQEFHGPGHWFDPDMLLIGRDIPDQYQHMQFVVYAMLSAPLMLSCNMSLIRPIPKQLLLNLDLIAIAQDPLGIMATGYNLGMGVTLWVKKHLPMKGDMHHSFSFAFVLIGTYAEVSSTVVTSFRPWKYGARSGYNYTLYNLLKSDLPIRNVSAEDSISVVIPPRDVTLITLYPI